MLNMNRAAVARHEGNYRKRRTFLGLPKSPVSSYDRVALERVSPYSPEIRATLAMGWDAPVRSMPDGNSSWAPVEI